MRIAGIGNATVGGPNAWCTLYRIVIEKAVATAVVRVRDTNASGAILHEIDAGAATAIGSYEIGARYKNAIYLEVAVAAAEATFVYS